MAYSDVSIINAGLTLIGESRIVLLGEDTKQAREASAVYETARNALLAAWNWNFAKTRALLSPDPVAPIFQYALKYQLPADCLRVMRVGNSWVGADQTNYRGSPVEDYTIEGQQILTNLSDSPLPLVYVKLVTDPTKFSANFAECLSAKMAIVLCEALSQSNAKKQVAMAHFRDEIRTAIRVNAIEVPPTKLPDDEWVLSRI